ncbi:hypothetical protein [Mycolicibacterium fortuitum]|uniref:Uncharacterized protein n=1 Tax=Mycolicibacterium fortuitum subsp. fortuitum DSM 46621 = ATCC 6841 = JCM 6387 TaxID=1214102 RepID=K0V1L8_MYCFO|nr:hypothetical protein MFORT_23827 [Mycolicibacterium fortuitum subsp. fortuitum DSM 46621 = ATCC 6841 = JCM 6387]
MAADVPVAKLFGGNEIDEADVPVVAIVAEKSLLGGHIGVAAGICDQWDLSGPSKAISDALRWEMAHGRVRRVAALRAAAADRSVA